MTDLCPDCGRPFAERMPDAISPKGPCARAFHPVGADDCMALALARLRRELANALSIANSRTYCMDSPEVLKARVGELEKELAEARAIVGQLPERFCLAVFAEAGMTLEQSSTALMVARRVLEDAETERYEAARTAPKEAE